MKESQLDNKTAIATNDYVRMVDENGNSVKIKKDSFMAAIRDALPSIISDGTTGGGSVLSIINGALKTRTDANLASVLGAVVNHIDNQSNLDDIQTIGQYYSWGTSRPLNSPWDFGTMICCFKSSGNYAQICVYRSTDFRIAVRVKDTGAWSPWKEFDLATIS